MDYVFFVDQIAKVIRADRAGARNNLLHAADKSLLCESFTAVQSIIASVR
jgi:transcriptional regulator of met regulon